MELRTALVIIGCAALVPSAGLIVRFASAQEAPSTGESKPEPANKRAPRPRAGTKRNLGSGIVLPPNVGLTPAQFVPGAPPTPGNPPNIASPGPTTPEAPVARRGRGAPANRTTFNVEDMDLPDLVRNIAQMTGKRFILSGKTRSIKASIVGPTNVSPAEAYQAFLSILDLNGMTVVPAGRYLKIIESTDVIRNPIATYTEGEATGTDDRYITRLHRMTNVTAEDMANLLSKFKSATGDITAYAPTNTIIITDTGANMRRMMRLIEAVDVPRGSEQVYVEPVHYANATELAARLTEIFPPGGASARPAAAPGAPPGAGSVTVGAGSGDVRVTKILADERTNSLIIIATQTGYLRVMEMLTVLDSSVEGEGRIHVHYLQHGQAEDISTALSGIVTGAGPRPTGAGAGQAGAATPFEGQIKVVAHKQTNSLVITSSLHDYAALRRVIDRLDMPRRQVFIEALIMELTTDRSSTLGFSGHGGVPNPVEQGSLLLFGSRATNSIGFPSQDALTGLALGIRGPNLNIPGISLPLPGFGFALSAIATRGDVNVISTPHILAMDNEEAEIKVGQNIALQQNFPGLGGAAGLAGAAGANPLLLSGLGGLGGSVQRQDIGTTLTITPHINDSDEIRLDVAQEISEAGSPEGSLGVVPINKRNAKTKLVVRDQETIVIGGIVRDAMRESEDKIPILGDIPLLGMLFRQTRRVASKTNLLLILTPYIVRSHADLRAIFERKMRERQEFMDRHAVFSGTDYTPPIDYSRTRGLLGEIFNEIRELEEEERLINETRARPPPEHVPRPPVGGDLGASIGAAPGDLVIDGAGIGRVEAPPAQITPSDGNPVPPATPVQPVDMRRLRESLPDRITPFQQQPRSGESQ